MAEDTKPDYGFFQPGLGTVLDLTFNSMKKTPRQPRTHGIMRGVLALNLRKTLEHRYQSQVKITNKIKQLAKDSKVGHGTIQRAMKEEAALTIDSIERLALALEVSVYQLMLPNLDANNPQIVKGATSEEQHMYARFKQSAAGLTIRKIASGS